MRWRVEKGDVLGWTLFNEANGKAPSRASNIYIIIVSLVHSHLLFSGVSVNECSPTDYVLNIHRFIQLSSPVWWWGWGGGGWNATWWGPFWYIGWYLMGILSCLCPMWWFIWHIAIRHPLLVTWWRSFCFLVYHTSSKFHGSIGYTSLCYILLPGGCLPS